MDVNVIVSRVFKIIVVVLLTIIEIMFVIATTCYLNHVPTTIYNYFIGGRIFCYW